MLKLSVLLLTGCLVAAHGDFAEKIHPRLLFPKAAEASLRARLSSDPLAAKLHAISLIEAEKILDERTCRYEIPDGRRLLHESRRALRNIIHSSWAWRLSGEERFRLRAIAELDAACALKDWNPSHFLDVAEMATAVAIGYDWLYPSLTAEQRTSYEQALVEKALQPAVLGYERDLHWTRPRNNWAQVCATGIGLAAAAVAELKPDLAESLFARSEKLIEECGALYQPDGMYPEGPSYWHYGTNYHVMFLAAAAGLDRPVKNDPILGKAGNSIMHLTSPSRMNYNFADGGLHRETPSPAQSWLATHYRDAAQSHHVRSLFERSLAEGKGRIKPDRYFPLSVLWLPAPCPPGPLPNAAIFTGEQPMALFRTGWNAEAAFLAIKGGTPAASHGHMDVGSFVFDAHGERWIQDLGAENYNLPAYFGNKRWSYYRLQNRSHSTLEIDSKLQDPASKPCPLTHSTLLGNSLEATFDLSAAYADAAEKVFRHARFDAREGTSILTDEITRPTGVVVWRAITDAKAEIDGDKVILRKGQKTITLHNRSGTGNWSLADTKPPTPEENQNLGILAVTLTVPQAESVRLEVEIQP
jgi:hypothetical protein